MQPQQPVPPSRFPASLIRGLGGCLRQWRLWLIIALILSPTTHHVLWTYVSKDNGFHSYKIRCNYLGVQGIANYITPEGTCPFITFIEHESGLLPLF